MTDTPTPAASSNGYCSTRKAARLLGVSTSTVQQMLEQGLLSGWKTAGGHRRIRLESVVHQLQAQHTQPRPARLRVLCIEPDAGQRHRLNDALSGLDVALQVDFATDGVDGLMAIGRDRPDILITCLQLPGLDCVAMLRGLASDPSCRAMDLVVAGNQPLPPELAHGLTRLSYPLPLWELRGYLLARLADLRRRAPGAAELAAQHTKPTVGK